MKETPLTQTHIDLGAKMAEFAGYNMPIVYSGINEEHLAVRNAVGVFDVSHMGEFILNGSKALDLIQKVTSNDASKLFPGRIQYSCLPNLDGGIVDDLLVYKLEEDKYMLVVNASNIQKDWDWISQFNTMGVEMMDVSAQTTLLAVQGPKAIETLQPLTEVQLANIEYYHFKKGTFAGIENVLISATGYTGAGGFELYFDNGNAKHIWSAIFSSGKNLGIKPIGLAARDTLRLEKGFCLYGNDIDDSTSPIEAGLGWVTKFTKDFNAKDIILKHREQGVSRKLVGFEMIEKGIPRHHYEILDDKRNKIGTVTSGTMSPSLQKGLGLGYVQTAFSKPGTGIFISIRNKGIKAQVCKTPFL